MSTGRRSGRYKTGTPMCRRLLSPLFDYSDVVRKGGFEPPRSCERQPLKLVRLPVPPLPRRGTENARILPAPALQYNAGSARSPGGDEGHGRRGRWRDAYDNRTGIKTLQDCRIEVRKRLSRGPREQPVLSGRNAAQGKSSSLVGGGGSEQVVQGEPEVEQRTPHQARPLFEAPKALRVYLSPCGRGYEGRVNVSEPLAKVGEGFSRSPTAKPPPSHPDTSPSGYARNRAPARLPP